MFGLMSVLVRVVWKFGCLLMIVFIDKELKMCMIVVVLGVMLMVFVSIGVVCECGVVGECYGIMMLVSVVVCDVEYCDVLCYMVWYLVFVGSWEIVLIIGLFDVLLFDVGWLFRDVLVVGDCLLILLFFYGNGGSVCMMGWLGIVLVWVGYLVIVVDYLGNNGVDSMILFGSVLIWLCVDDLCVVLVVVQVDLVLGLYVDFECLGVVGFLVGGYIVLLVVGV